jgi:hypothetical protein
MGDGDEKDRPENLCLKPVPVAPDLVIARCLDLISVGDVIRAVELYHRGGAMSYLPSSSLIRVDSDRQPRGVA